MKKLVLAIPLFLLSSSVYAETGMISGITGSLQDYSGNKTPYTVEVCTQGNGKSVFSELT